MLYVLYVIKYTRKKKLLKIIRKYMYSIYRKKPVYFKLMFKGQLYVKF